MVMQLIKIIRKKK